VGTKEQGSFVRSKGTVVLDSEPSVHAVHTGIVDPGDTELNQAFWFHDGFGNKGILRVTIKDWAERSEDRVDSLNVFRFVGIATLGFPYEKIGSFHSSFEANISLTTKERFVSPAFGNLHGLMYPLFMSD
jgi:hypothetical protein